MSSLWRWTQRAASIVPPPIFQPSPPGVRGHVPVENVVRARQNGRRRFGKRQLFHGPAVGSVVGKAVDLGVAFRVVILGPGGVNGGDELADRVHVFGPGPSELVVGGFLSTRSRFIRPPRSVAWPSR